jgi:acyl dehydratase
MAVKTDGIGKQWDPATYEIGAEKIREFADAVGAANPVHRDHEAARAAGFRDLVAPPMFCVVYSARAMGPAILDPELGINLATMLHGSQEFEWDEPVCDGDVISTTATCNQIYERNGEGDLDEHREGGLMSEIKTGDAIPELRVTPDKYLPHRYAGASGDFNPIHIDPEFARQVGLPGNILHGLWMMAQVARGNAQLADGDPRALKRLSVQFRGMGFPEQELVVTGTVKEVDGDRVVVDTLAAQGENQVIRNAEAEVHVP